MSPWGLLGLLSERHLVTSTSKLVQRKPFDLRMTTNMSYSVPGPMLSALHALF